MDRPIETLICQIWDTEEMAGISHYLQTKDEFIKQLSFKSLDELMVRLGEAEKALPEFTPNYISDLIHHQFESCKVNFELGRYDDIYESWTFWFAQYTKLIPRAFEKNLISEDNVYLLLEKAGDYFGGYETEDDLKDAWLPFNSILELGTN